MSTSQSDHARSVFRNNLGGQDAYTRHVRYITQFQNVYNPAGSAQVKAKGRSEMDGLVENHKFLRDDDDKELQDLGPEERIAVKYYRGLFKEFAVVDLKHYKSGQFALRWRTEPEVISGLGQFTCGNTRCAYHQADDDRPVPQPKLITLELPFGYVEDQEAKSALVKVVLCERCKKKLMWKREKDREVTELGEGDDRISDRSKGEMVNQKTKQEKEDGSSSKSSRRERGEQDARSPRRDRSSRRDRRDHSRERRSRSPRR
ncbi:Protein FRA10AC1 [Homo sapiens] [Rhizoctonia solani]|uniref:Protein FRA10AC1 [Homo sapiens] n=1 Tax=Rhizoctonia solani TaxID=456999 RepID=A0A0K6FR92_9AGAM|nr:Protein FRA10AC1 [Homo sapiens] [Rhizoctonia solani]